MIRLSTNPFDIPCLDGTAPAEFPPTSEALYFPNGLLAWGGSLSPQRLIEAYRRGIFPWYSEGQPVLWWSPAPRCVLEPDKVYISSRSRRRLRQGEFEVTADEAFREVIEGCAAPRENRPETWITAQMTRAFATLHEMGVAHSVEAWSQGELAGGVYGLAIGRVFFGESMFSIRPDASKVALISLCRQLRDWGYRLIDCQVSNPHLLGMGAEEVDRDRFEAWLERLIDLPGREGSWAGRYRHPSDW